MLPSNLLVPQIPASKWKKTCLKIFYLKLKLKLQFKFHLKLHYLPLEQVVMQTNLPQVLTSKWKKTCLKIFYLLKVKFQLKLKFQIKLQLQFKFHLKLKLQPLEQKVIPSIPPQVSASKWKKTSCLKIFYLLRVKHYSNHQKMEQQCLTWVPPQETKDFQKVELLFERNEEYCKQTAAYFILGFGGRGCLGIRYSVYGPNRLYH